MELGAWTEVAEVWGGVHEMGLMNRVLGTGKCILFPTEILGNPMFVTLILTSSYPTKKVTQPAKIQYELKSIMSIENL